MSRAVLLATLGVGLLASSAPAFAYDIDLSEYFWDPDGDPLTYQARVEPDGIISVSLDGSVLTIAGLRIGEATMHVRACDPWECSDWESVSVLSVPAETPGPEPDAELPSPCAALWSLDDDAPAVVGGPCGCEHDEAGRDIALLVVLEISGSWILCGRP